MHPMDVYGMMRLNVVLCTGAMWLPLVLMRLGVVLCTGVMRLELSMSTRVMRLETYLFNGALRLDVVLCTGVMRLGLFCAHE